MSRRMVARVVVPARVTSGADFEVTVDLATRPFSGATAEFSILDARGLRRPLGTYAINPDGEMTVRLSLPNVAPGVATLFTDVTVQGMGAESFVDHIDVT